MKIQDEIKAELQALQIDFGVSRTTDNVFQVPEEFFNTFPNSMMEIVTAMNADTVFNIDTPTDNPYQVPANYFENFGGIVMQRVKDFDTIVEDGIVGWNDSAKQHPLTIPDNYFESFAANLLTKINAVEEDAVAETEALSPLLASLKHEQPFEVPSGYFDAKAIAEKAKIAEHKTVEHPAVRSIKWARWAAAAAVVFIFSIGGIQFLGKSSVAAQDSLEQSLAKIPEEDLREWLGRNMYEQDMNMAGKGSVSASLQSFSEKEIEDYLATDVW